MKLLTDNRTDREAFGKDYEKACRNYSKAMSHRPKNGSKEVAKDVVEVTKYIISDPYQSMQDMSRHDVPCWVIEEMQAMTWLAIVVIRWMEIHEAHSGQGKVWMDDHAQKMFVGIAMKVAQDVAGSDVYASDED